MLYSIQPTCCHVESILDLVAFSILWSAPKILTEVVTKVSFEYSIALTFVGNLASSPSLTCVSLVLGS